MILWVLHPRQKDRPHGGAAPLDLWLVISWGHAACSFFCNLAEVIFDGVMSSAPLLCGKAGVSR